MEERKASLIAAALGGLAVTGFWAVRPTKPSANLRVVDQWSPRSRSGPDGDAAAMFRVDLRGLSLLDERTVVYHVVGEAGADYPLVPASTVGTMGILKLPRGYARPLTSPRIVAKVGTVTLASIPLAPLPPPKHHPLIPSAAAPLRLVLRGSSGLFAEPRRPVPSDEQWRVVARRTTHADGLETASGVTPYAGRSAGRLNVPFADEAGLVELDLTRFRLVPESDVVQIDGLRLVKRFGGTALVVDHTIIVPNRLGALIRLPMQDNGPRHPSPHNDPRVASLNLSLSPSWMTEPDGDFHRMVKPGIDVLEPTPESLGLRELRIGPQRVTVSRRPSGPVREGTFSARLRITFYRPVPIESRRLVLPVTFGAARWFPEVMVGAGLQPPGLTGS